MHMRLRLGIKLDSVFDFSARHLPPAPYNQAGKPCEKSWWRNWRQSPTKYQPDEKQGRFLAGTIWEMICSMWSFIIHLYALGQFYHLSPDLVDTVVEEASSNHT
jgi:hypothetical protein